MIHRNGGLVMRDLIGALLVCIVGIVTCLVVAAQVALWYEAKDRGWR